MNVIIKTMLIIGIIFLLVFGVYIIQSGTVDSKELLSSSISDIEMMRDDFIGDVDNIDISEISKLFIGVSSISFDDSILRSDVFLSLREIIVPIGTPNNIGRQNPFLPIGVSDASSQSDTDLGVNSDGANENTVGDFLNS